MARISKSVKLYQDIQQNPELRQINTEVNQINEMIARMGRSEYFKGIGLPERMDKYALIESAKSDIETTKSYLSAIKGTLTNIWNERRSETALSNRTGILRADGEYIKVLNLAPESSAKRSTRTGRGVLSEKATRTLLADDIEMLKRLTKKSDADIMNFLNLWYSSPEVSGGQLLENFVDAVYKSEYSGQGASQSWGSPPVRMIIEERIIESFDINVEYDETNVNASWETESKMGNELFQAWMDLFN